MTVVLVLMAVVLPMAPLTAQENAASPIEGLRDAYLGKTSNIIYGLNSDNTISGYDIVNGTVTIPRAQLRSVLSDPDIKEIASSPNGKMLAVRYNDADRLTHVALFGVPDPNADEPLVLLHDYQLGRDVPQGYIRMTVAGNGRQVYVVYGPGFVYALSADPNNREQREIIVGDTPLGMAEAPNGTIYVLNEKSETVSVVPSGAGEVSATIPVGTSPSDIHYNDVTGNVYVSHVGSNDVYVIDTQSNSVEEVVSVGGDPTTLRSDAQTGEVFVVNNSSGSLSTISPSNEVTTVELGSSAYFKSARIDAYYKQSSRDLYLLNTTESSYQVYDAATGNVSEPVDTQSFPMDIFGTTQSPNVFFWHWSANSFSEIDVATGRHDYVSETDLASETFLAKPQSITVDEATNRIFVSNLGSDYITVIDGETQSPVEKIPVGRTIQNVFLHEGLGKLYAVSPSDNTVTSIEINNDYRSKTITLAEQSRGGAINEVTDHIYYSNSRAGTISVVDAVADEVIGEITFPDDSYPLVSTVDESRNRLYVSLYGADAIAVVDGETNTIESTIETGPNPIFVRYIPQIDRIFATIEGAEQVLVIDPDDPNNVQTVALPGEPYRIFFNQVSENVYINRRGEDLVSELVQNDAGEYELRSTEPMKYWGETDARPFNMVTYNSETGLAYFTAGLANEVVVVDVSYDEDGSVISDWYATINADGSVLFAESDRQRAGDRDAQEGDDAGPVKLFGENSDTIYLVLLITVPLLLAGIALIVYVLRRKSEEHLHEEPPTWQ